MASAVQMPSQQPASAAWISESNGINLTPALTTEPESAGGIPTPESG